MPGSYDRVMEERKILVEKIISNMKNGYVMPKPDWNKGAFPDTRIRNPVSGARYHGINAVRLYIETLEKGYTDGRWMTYKQAQSMGWQVKKGEQGIRCEKYIFTKQIEEENPDTGEMEKKTIRLTKPMVNTFVVFNASQIEGIPEQEVAALEPLKPDEILEMAELFQKSSACPIREEDQNRAYYSPGRDEIVLPNRNAFLDSQSFLATQLHEMVHSTGHPDRLNRPLAGMFGSPGYAMEELRAELGAFFIQTDLNLQFDTQHFNSHTQYLESWIGALEKDPNELFRAITDAQKASDFLEERYELQVKKEAKELDAFTIYQLKHEAPSDFHFRSLDMLQSKGLNIDPANYEKVYSAPLTPEMTLEGLYKKFNIDHPEDFKGHSLSVSDVIVLHQNGQDTAHYVDDIGFSDVSLAFLHEPEAVFRLDGESYLYIQESEMGIDYTFYDKDFVAQDGGQIDNPDLTMDGACKEVLEFHEMNVKQIDRVSVLEFERSLEQMPEKEAMKLTKQQEAAVRMAAKHELKKTGSGMEFLDHWIKEDAAKRQEIGIPMEEERTYSSMRNKFNQLLENPEQVLKAPVKGCSR